MENKDTMVIASTEIKVLEEMTNYWKERGYVPIEQVYSDKSSSLPIFYYQKLKKQQGR